MRKIRLYFMSLVCVVFGSLQVTYTSANVANIMQNKQYYANGESDEVYDYELDDQIHCEMDLTDNEILTTGDDQTADSGISLLSTIKGADFDDFTLKSKKTYTLVFNISANKYDYGRVYFTPSKTAKIAVGLIDVNTDVVVSANTFSFTAGKSYTVTSAIPSGHKVNFIFGNDNSYNIGMSNVSVEKWAC